MAVSRVAVEREDQVVQILVLCADCLANLGQDLHPEVRRLVRPVRGLLICQFCMPPGADAKSV